VGKSQEKNYGIIWNRKKCWDGGGGVHHFCWYYWRNSNSCNLYPL